MQISVYMEYNLIQLLLYFSFHINFKFCFFAEYFNGINVFTAYCVGKNFILTKLNIF